LIVLFLTVSVALEPPHRIPVFRRRSFVVDASNKLPTVSSPIFLGIFFCSSRSMKFLLYGFPSKSIYCSRRKSVCFFRLWCVWCLCLGAVFGLGRFGLARARKSTPGGVQLVTCFFRRDDLKIFSCTALSWRFSES